MDGILFDYYGGILFNYYLQGNEPSADDAFVFGDVFLRYSDTPWVINLFTQIDEILIWLHTHPAYQAIVAGIFYILASWLVFMRRMMFFEVFFSQLYISCQMQIVGAVWVLIMGSEAYFNLPPFAVPVLIGLPLLCYDYAQLYNLRWWSALWRTVLTFVLTLMLMLVIAAVPIFLVKIFWNNDNYEKELLLDDFCLWPCHDNIDGLQQ